MTTFDESWSGRLRKVGDLERPDHWFLTEADDCVFFGEYTARAGYGHSSTNQLIHNLKKKPELSGTPQYVWKGRAIDTIGRAIPPTCGPTPSRRSRSCPFRPPSRWARRAMTTGWRGSPGRSAPMSTCARPW
jgi:hypothetical protein